MSDAEASISCQSMDSLNLQEIFLNYFDDQIYTDVDFSVQCGGDFVAYKAHRLPLAIFSPVFEDMFYGSTQGYKNPVTINDVTPNVFIAMLKFMYGSESEVTRQQRDVSFLLKLYKAAIQYQIADLQCLCRKKLRSLTPNKHSVFQLLDAANITNEEGIRLKCLKVLQTRTAEVLASQEDLGDVSHAMMMTIINLKKVSFSSEFELISWVFAWAINEHLRLNKQEEAGKDKEEKQKKKSLRHVLDSVLGHVDLTAMEPQDFGRLLKNHPGVFSESEICKIFRNIVDPGCCDLPDWAKANISRTYSYTG